MVSREDRKRAKLRLKAKVEQDERKKLKGKAYKVRVDRKIDENGKGQSHWIGKRLKVASAIQKPRKRANLKPNRVGGSKGVKDSAEENAPVVCRIEVDTLCESPSDTTTMNSTDEPIACSSRCITSHKSRTRASLKTNRMSNRKNPSEDPVPCQTQQDTAEATVMTMTTVSSSNPTTSSDAIEPVTSGSQSDRSSPSFNEILSSRIDGFFEESVGHLDGQSGDIEKTFEEYGADEYSDVLADIMKGSKLPERQTSAILPEELWSDFIKSFPREEWIPNIHDTKWKEFLVRYEATPGEIAKPDYVTRHQGCFPKSLFTEAMVFYPTEDMMSNFERFIAFLFDRGAHVAGGCKVIPYPGYLPNKNIIEEANTMVWKCWKQSASIPAYKNNQTSTDRSNAFVVKFSDPLEANIQEFYDMCKLFNSPTSSYDVGSKIQEHLPWSQAYYGKDNNGTLFDDEAMFNLDRLDTRLSRDWTRNGELRKERIEKDTKRKMNTKSGDNIRKKISEDETGDGEGLIRSYLYLGSFGSSFCDHIEDRGQASINYLHFGANKNWRITSPLFGTKQFALLKKHSPKGRYACTQYAGHKNILLKDEELTRNNIPFLRFKQTAGSFMITFPFAFHAGYSDGFNCGEASNFTFGEVSFRNAMFHPGCNRLSKKGKVCDDGYVPWIPIDYWASQYMTKVDYETWKKGRYVGYHPYDLGIGSKYSAKPDEYCGIPSYHCDPVDENLDLSWKLRKIYDDRSEVEMLRQLDIRQVWATAKQDMLKNNGEEIGTGGNSK